MALVIGAGCSHFDLRKPIPWVKGENGELERPMKVVAMWKDTVMTQGDAVAVRGFGGRLMFYADEESKPIKVKGSLVVYAFDETGRDPSNVVPDRKYVFTEEEFEEHYSESSLGHSYSVWIPWDRAGGLQSELSLLARFTTEDGAVVVGEQSTHLLPGKPNPNMNQQTPPPAAHTAASAGVQQISYQAPFQPPANMGATPVTAITNSGSPAGQPWMQQSSKQMTTTTISLSNRPPVALPINQLNAAAGAVDGAAVTQPSAGPVQSSAPQASMQPSAHFGPGRSRPLGAPIAQLSRDRGPWRPPHVGWPSGSSIPPQSAPGPGTGGSSPVVGGSQP
jgi:hypothetical protein